MTSRELRQKFLEFFRAKGHTIIPSASLIPPETDPTVLFTTAGMHPLVPYLLGENHPGGNRVASIQKCIRTADIDEVGDNRHLTFFEMLGNWSFGDYFKKEAIEWSWEFLTDKKWLGIDPKRITVTVFEGDQDAPRDEESAGTWKSLGIPEDKIDYKNKDENWWGPAGATGPCGPDTEMFIDGVEIWNDVFMEYNRQPTTNNQQQYEYIPLKQKNVDTGMGLERIAMIMQGKKSVYETDLLLPITKAIEASLRTLRTTRSEASDRSFRIIADHIKASVFIIADGVTPLNIGRGYVLRRLIRRAIRHGKLLGIDNNFTKTIAEVVVDIYKDSYPEVLENRDKIFEELEKENNKFRKTLEKGLKKLKEYVDKKEDTSEFAVKHREEFGSRNTDFVDLIPGKDAFDLYQTYGFPPELIKEELANYGMGYHKEEFQQEYDKHQQLSRTSSAGQFKGGLAEAGEETAKLHTATHLLLAALREVLGPNVYQKGSNITSERLRFDFSHGAKMTEEELKKAENRVNEIIRENVPIECQEMSMEEAKKAGAIGVFESKYGDKIKVYKAGNYSSEICGGPHAKNTGELGHFKIIKEEASSAGVRRIKAILE